MNTFVRVAPPLESENLGVKRLAIEVITLALKDAKSRRASSSVVAAKDHEARDARSFLTDASGGWARSRAYWCALADLDPDALRERVLAQLSEK